MNNEKDFLIPFVGLKLGKHHFDFHVEKSFIESFGYDDFDEISVNVDLELDKKATHLELLFSHSGTVTLPCDVTNEVFDLPISGQLKLIVKFGEEFNDDNEELLILPFAEFQVDIKQYVYEMIVLSIPVKRIHPDVVVDEEDELDFLDDEDFELFDSINDEDDLDEDEEENESEKQESETQNDTIDPRWEKLKQLLTDK
ncbi:DUF177 domain-containing protein [Flavobacterium agricola]|uniref:DUF177 domain-containing protein n=1 Tax=Flavobacterium agricola TaxID=2870839 RepID=A0ABY6LXX6_9FLAO|nr:DUF177 domain-containing protein [Flavobacterium agricola]UYW01190.1 DUF177 domain-containing protein [Flavobacterium agricola]